MPPSSKTSINFNLSIHSDIDSNPSPSLQSTVLSNMFSSNSNKKKNDSNPKNNTNKSCNCSSSSTDDDSNSSMSNVDQTEEEAIIIKKLSLRAYHLPGNNYRQDWAMYIKNNHLVFGLCSYHPLHPVTIKHRLIILLGSLAFGLSITNAVYLYHVWRDEGYDDTAISLTLGGDFSENIPDNYKKLDISRGMATLWTVGAGAHSMFDLLLWHMIACGCCCRRKFFQSVGLYIAISITSVVVALSSFVALVRAYQTEGEDGSTTTASPAIGFEFTNSTSAGTTPEEGYYSPINFGDGEPDFQFLWGYLVELFASLFVYTPLVQTLLFTGVLGCGVMPFFGGRPREVRREKAHQQQLRNSKKVTLKATDGADGKV